MANNGTIEFLRKTGATEAQLASLTARQQSAPHLELFPENVEVWRLWTALGTQWRVGVGMGGVVWTGLDYSVLDFAMRMHRIGPDRQPEMFDLIRLMEREAAPLLNDRK